MTALNDVESAWQYFIKIYSYLVDNFVPTKAVNNVHTIQEVESTKVKNRPRVDKHILRTKRRKHRLWQRYMETRDGQKYEIFKKERNKLKGQLWAARRRLFKHISNDAKRSPKKFWAFVNSKRSFKEDIPELTIKNSDGSVHTTNGATE